MIIDKKLYAEHKSRCNVMLQGKEPEGILAILNRDDEPSRSKYFKGNIEKQDEETREKTKKKTKRKKNNVFIKEFKEIRESILERDQHKCTVCGSEKNLHVHHKIHRKHGGTNNFDNLATLCKWCHAEQHRSEPVYNIMTK